MRGAVARCAPAVAMPSPRVERARSGARPRAETVTGKKYSNGKARSPRRRPVVCRAVRLSGHVSAPKPAPAAAVTVAGAGDGPGCDRDAAVGRHRTRRGAAPGHTDGGSASSASATERDIVVENDAVRAVFTNRGGVLKSWMLKRYKDHNGGPLDLVPQIVRGAPRPFSLLVDDGEGVGDAAKRRVQGERRRGERRVDAGDTGVRLHATAPGCRCRRRSPSIPRTRTCSASMRRHAGRRAAACHRAVRTGARHGHHRAQRQLQSAGAAHLLPRRIGDARQGLEHPEEPQRAEGAFGFVGVDDHYFLTAALPDKQAVHVEYQPVSVPVDGLDDGRQFRVLVDALRRDSRSRPHGSFWGRRTSTSWRRSTAIWCARSTSGCSRGLSCRCCAR